MIVGIGSDLIEISRIGEAMARHKGRFEARCFTPYELERGAVLSGVRRAAFFAKRFAAKEACAKALGIGFIGAFGLRDIGVEQEASGRPYLELSGGAKTVLLGRMQEGYKPRLHLTISDERAFALAFVVIEAARE